LNSKTVLRQPNGCTGEQRREFARLVRRGFKTAGADLESRIRAARCLAFHCPAGDKLAAIAALKSRSDQYRQEVFAKASSPVSCADYKAELGWVYVEPEFRGNRLATKLCERLLSHATADCVFATTRTDNASMIHVLVALGFANAGTPYMHRDERLNLYLRPCWMPSDRSCPTT